MFIKITWIWELENSTSVINSLQSSYSTRFAFFGKIVTGGRAYHGSFDCRLYVRKLLYEAVWAASGISRKNDRSARVIRKG